MLHASLVGQGLFQVVLGGEARNELFYHCHTAIAVEREAVQYIAQGQIAFANWQVLVVGVVEVGNVQVAGDRRQCRDGLKQALSIRQQGT
ncbi:hypothetical protein D3C76_1512750 [compost metagenome]